MKTNLASIFLCAGFSAFACLAGCAANSEEPAAGDAEDAEGEVVESEEAVTGAPSNFGYFIVTRRDFRRCVSPICGGFFVKRVNDAKTLCADGVKRAECYVSEIQLGGTGLSAREQAEFRAALEGGHALVKARTYKKRWSSIVYGTLKASEAWMGATGSAPDGTFYRAADNGIRCITAPCPSTSASTLNGADSHNVTAVHLDTTDVPASTEALDAASNALGTKEGILIAGGIALPKCPPATPCGPFVTASEFYLRVVRREGRSCGGHTIAGPTPCNANQYCSYEADDICGAADAPGTCAYRPEFCIELFKPVCGCDGNTYGNACKAAAAGASVSHDGTCKP